MRKSESWASVMSRRSSAVPKDKEAFKHSRKSSTGPLQSKYLASVANHRSLLTRLKNNVIHSVTLPRSEVAFNGPQNRRLDHGTLLQFIVESVTFDLCVIMVVIVDIVTLLLGDSVDWTSLMVISTFVVLLFLLEVFMKLEVYGVYGYFKDVWNIADAGIAIISALGYILDVGVNGFDDNRAEGTGAVESVAEGMRIVRILRIARVAKLVIILRRKAMAVNIFDEKNHTVSLPMVLTMDILHRCSYVLGDPNVERFSTGEVSKQDIEWIMSTLQSGKLYHPTVKLDQKLPQEVLDIMGGSKAPPAPSGPPNFGLTPGGKPDYVSKFGLEHATDLFKEFEIERWDLDVFRLAAMTLNHALAVVGYYYFHRTGLMSEFDIDDDVLIKWLLEIEKLYAETQFHNSTRAASVAAAVGFFLCSAGVVDNLTPEETLALCIASIVMDVGHPGLTNEFLKHTDNILAVEYNYHSCLENHSVALMLEALDKEGSQILANLANASKIQDLATKLVLATDTTNHFPVLSRLNSKLVLTKGGVDLQNSSEDRMLVMSVVIRAADLSFSVHSGTMYTLWHNRVLQEYYRQGDLERQAGLKISMHMDRDEDDIRQVQLQNKLGFLNVVVSPFYGCLLDLLPRFCGQKGRAVSQDITSAIVSTRKSVEAEVQ